MNCWLIAPEDARITPREIFLLIYVFAWSDALRPDTFRHLQIFRVFRGNSKKDLVKDIIRFFLGIFCIDGIPFYYLLSWSTIFAGMEPHLIVFAAIFFAFMMVYSIPRFTRLVLFITPLLYPPEHINAQEDGKEGQLYTDLIQELNFHRPRGDVRAIAFYAFFLPGIACMIVSYAERKHDICYCAHFSICTCATFWVGVGLIVAAILLSLLPFYKQAFWKRYVDLKPIIMPDPSPPIPNQNPQISAYFQRTPAGQISAYYQRTPAGQMVP